MGKSLHWFLLNILSRNTKTIDLWNVFNEIEKTQDYATMMAQWTKVQGFPIVTVEMTAQEDGVQEWQVCQRSCHDENSSTLWYIPLSYITSQGDSGVVMLSEESQSIKIQA